MSLKFEQFPSILRNDKGISLGRKIRYNSLKASSSGAKVETGIETASSSIPTQSNPLYGFTITYINSF